MIRSVRKRRVVKPPLLLRHMHRFATYLQHQGVGDRNQRRGGGNAENAAHQPIQIERGAGKGHNRVQCKRQRTHLGSWLKDRDTEAAAGVHDQLAGPPGAYVCQPSNQPRQHVVRHGDQDKVSRRADIRRRYDTNAR